MTIEVVVENVNENCAYAIQYCLHLLMDDNFILLVTKLIFLATIKAYFVNCINMHTLHMTSLFFQLKY
jgi:hypothetical protein